MLDERLIDALFHSSTRNLHDSYFIRTVSVLDSMAWNDDSRPLNLPPEVRQTVKTLFAVR
jgi:hypothetical protein